MNISGGEIKFDVLEEIWEDTIDGKKDKLAIMEKKRRSRIIKQEKYTRKIMSEQGGREWLWEFVMNAPIMNLNPYTGNATTYYILGEQRPTRDLITYLKQIDLKLYHLMEKEAQERKNREENE